MRPRRAAEAFWRCEQAFERRTSDMTYFPPLISPPPFLVPFRESARCWIDGGALGARFRGIGVGKVYRILMGTGWERPWSPARSRRRAKGGLYLISRDNESRSIYPESLGR